MMGYDSEIQLSAGSEFASLITSIGERPGEVLGETMRRNYLCRIDKGNEFEQF